MYFLAGKNAEYPRRLRAQVGRQKLKNFSMNFSVVFQYLQGI